MRFIPLAIAALALFGYSVDVRGQVRSDPGVVIGGRVSVRVYVSLSEDETPYAPIAGLQLRFFRSVTDSVVGRTDEAGAATVMLAPGDYRLVSGSPTTWKGARYTWSVPISVRAGMSTIDLKASLADRTSEVAASRPTVLEAERNTYTPPAEPTRAPQHAFDPTRTPKDGTTATLFGLLITGTGHMYAGEGGTGALLLVLGVGGAAVAYAGAMQGGDCPYDYYSSCDQPNETMMAIGGGVSLVAWLISVIDAHSAARRYNEKWGLTRQVSVRPVIAPTRNGQTALGLSFAVGHGH